MDTTKRLQNLTLKRERRKQSADSDTEKSIAQLRKLLALDDDEFDTIKQFIPIRLVSIIESVVRHYIAILVDHNATFRDRAAELVIRHVKFDYRLVSAVEGGEISLGELVSDEVPVNSLGDIVSPFTKILDTDFWTLIAAASPEEDENRQPIIKDLSAIKSRLGRLFDVRHIVVHEWSDRAPFTPSEATEFIDATETFLLASEAALRAHLWWRNKHFLAEQLVVARDDERAALKTLEDKVNGFSTDSDLAALCCASHTLWIQFIEAQRKFSKAIYDEEIADLFVSIDLTAYIMDRIKYLDQLTTYRASQPL